MAEIPAKIGKYKIEKLIAKGGMGEVYKGLHPTLKRDVILKKLTIHGNKQFVERFNREARIMMDFKNDNIVDVYDHFKEGEAYYIVLEYVDGMALDSFIQKERYINNDLALYIILEISKALKYAHDKNVVHRDIKPGNILISKTGEIKLVDFGIAVSEEESDQNLTKVGMTLGTPSYMAPEQFENTKNVDKRADIYSVGVMLYEMVTGKKPYPSGLTPECINQIQKGKHKAANKVNPRVNRMVLGYIKRLMHPRKNKRIQDLGTIIHRLERFFRKQNIGLFKERISDSILDKKLKALPVKKSNKFILPLLIVIIVGIGSYLFINSGLQYEIFRSGSYGALRIKLRVDKKYNKEVDEIFIKSKLWREKINGSLDLRDNSNYDFIIKPDNEGNFNIFETKRIYLPKGFYRLKFMVDGNIFWANFQIKSRNIQKQNANTVKGLLVELQHKEPNPLPFNPKLRVINQVTKEDITAESNLLHRGSDKDKYKKFVNGVEGLKTGQVHYFRITKKDFYQKDFVLWIGPDQTEMDLDAELYPNPGTIKVITNQEDIKIRLNGERSYIKGDLNQDYIKLDKLGVDGENLLLTPGEYNLLFTYKGNKIEKTVTVQSNKEVVISVNYNKENKSISIDGK